MRVLVVGGSGFIGKHIVRRLLMDDYNVRVLDKVIYSDKIPEFYRKNIEMIEGGIEEPETVETAMRGVDVVYHVAWSFSEKLKDTIQIDVEGSINLMDAAHRHGVKHILFASSSVVYGLPQYIPIDEKHPCTIELSRAPMHALSKWIVEKLLEVYYAQYSIPYTIFRFWWAYSDERIPGKTLRDLIKKATLNDSIEYPKNAGGSIAYVGDIAESFLRATLNNEAFGEIFNIGSFYISWEEIIKMIVKMTKSTSKMEPVDAEKWDGSGFMSGSWLLDTTKLSKKLGVQINEKERKAQFERVLNKMFFDGKC